MRSRRALAGLVAGLLLLGFVGWRLVADDTVEVTADFARTTGLYEGNDVTVLGVKVGEVTSIRPAGPVVSVRMELDPDVAIPADARAVVMQRSLVTDRYVELAPAYDEGGRLAAGAHIPLERTVSPIGTDDVFESVNRLLEALQRTEDGGLSRLVSVAADNARGNGATIRRVVTSLRKLVALGAASDEELTAIVTGLDSFTAALERRDALVNRFSGDLTAVTEQFAADRTLIADTLTDLDRSMRLMARFLKRNGDVFAGQISLARKLNATLVEHQRQLGTILDIQPLAYENTARVLDKNGRVVVNANLLGSDIQARVLTQACGVLGADCGPLAAALQSLGIELPPALQEAVHVLGDVMGVLP